MVRGLERFRHHFAGWSQDYVIIGGTACDLAFNAAGLQFRATKDVDMVLCSNAPAGALAAAIWEFVRTGKYESHLAATGAQRYYRFHRPKVEGYPAMLELFAPAMPELEGRLGHITPVETEGPASNLSAILLEPDYQRWIVAGRIEVERLSILRPEHLIPLKAKAWLDLTARLNAGQRIQSHDIRKHRNDVYRLAQLISPTYEAPISLAVLQDTLTFLRQMADDPVNLATLEIRNRTQLDVLTSLEAYYQALPTSGTAS